MQLIEWREKVDIVFSKNYFELFPEFVHPIVILRDASNRRHIISVKQKEELGQNKTNKKTIPIPLKIHNSTDSMAGPPL